MGQSRRSLSARQPKASGARRTVQAQSAVTVVPPPEKAEGFSSRSRWLGLAAVIAAVVLVYANALQNGFTMDDEILIQTDTRIRSLKEIPSLFAPPVPVKGVATMSFGYRPIRELTYAIDYQFSGLNPVGYHLTNLLLHGLASCLAFLLALRLLGSLLPALATGLIFAVHPVQTEAVAYVTGRKDALVAIFYLAGVLSFLSYRAHRSRLALAGVIVSYLLALLSKESGITLPLTLLALDAALQPSSRRPWWGSLAKSLGERRPLYLGLFATAALFGLYVATLSGASAQREWWGGGLGSTLATSARIHLHYLGLLLFPATLSASYQEGGFRVSSTILDPVGLLALALLAAIVFLFYRLARVSPLGAFGGLWIFITLLPVAQLIPHHVLLADRFLYLPCFGFALLAGALLAQLTPRVRAAHLLYIGVALLLVVLAVRSAVRNRDWRDNFTLWAKTVQTSPGSARAHANFGEMLRKRNRLDEADAHFQMALRIDPDQSQARVGMGALLAMRGRLTDAERELRAAVRLDPTFWIGFLELGRLYLQQGRWSEAEAALKRAVRLNPRFWEAYLNLGLAYLGQGRPAEAEAPIGQAIAIKPDAHDAHLALGRLRLQAGRADEAIAHFQEAVRLKADNPYAHNNLGVLYAQMGKIEQAMAEFQAALRINPNFAEAQANLARLNGRRGAVGEADPLPAQE